jgi:hypothetical protein
MDQPGMKCNAEVWPTSVRDRAAEILTLERTLSDLVNRAYGLTPAEIALMWQPAPLRMPILPPSRFARPNPKGIPSHSPGLRHAAP